MQGGLVRVVAALRGVRSAMRRRCDGGRGVEAEQKKTQGYGDNFHGGFLVLVGGIRKKPPRRTVTAS